MAVRVPPIVTLTPNPALDLATEVDALVAGPKLRCGPVRREAGGGGINVARAVTALGGDALALYAAGGPPGAMLEDALVAEGVPARRLPIAGITRENLAVLERAGGARYRFVLPGPTLSPAEWRRCVDAAVDAADGPYLVASGSLPPGAPDDLYARLARALEPRGVRLLLDTSGRALRAAVEGGVHLVKPNFRELDELAGAPLGDDEREALAERIVRKGGADVVIVTLGPAGALLVSPDAHVRIAAPAVGRPDSPVGAGDGFMAGLALALTGGRSPSDACALGVAAAAASMLTPGTAPCRRPDVERMLRDMGAAHLVDALPAAPPEG
jgi:6-phosphofructokinase 2